MRALILTALAFAALAAEPRAASACSSAWRIAASGSGGDAMASILVVTLAGGLESAGIKWDELARRPWRPPLAGGAAAISCGALPAIPLAVTADAPEELMLPVGAARRIRYRILGALRGDEGDAARAYADAGLAAIELDGAGYIVEDAKSGEPIAGGLRIRRRDLSSRWRVLNDVAVESDVDVAWSLMRRAGVCDGGR